MENAKFRPVLANFVASLRKMDKYQVWIYEACYPTILASLVNRKIIISISTSSFKNNINIKSIKKHQHEIH